MKFLCDNCKAKYQIADDKVAGKTVRMKCRKCGHQIEVRSAVTETSVSSLPPKAPAAPRPAAPRSSLATSLSAQKPKAPSQHPSGAGSALAGAFQRTVDQAPASGAEPELVVSVTDEWYVAINGVPVGPIRISELRRKAAAGAVTEDSLCWQEGLEEWRPVRAVPELAALLREAAQGNRVSLVNPPAPNFAAPPPPAPPAPEPMRPSAPSKPPAPPARPAAPQTARTPEPPPRPFTPPAPPAQRSNVVPLHAARTSSPEPEKAPVTAPLGGAAAALAMSPSLASSPDVFAPAPAPAPAPLPPPPQPIADPFAGAIATSDPFAVPGAPAGTTPLAAPMQPMFSMASSPSLVPAAPAAPAPTFAPAEPARSKGPPLWFWPILVLALAFGGGAAFFVFRPQPQPQIVVQVPAPTQTATQAPSADVPPPVPTTDTSATPATSSSSGPAKVATNAKGGTAPATTKPGGGAADLTGLLGNGGGTGPAVGPNGGGAAGSGGGLDQAGVERVVAQHRVGVRRTCWERGSQDQKSSVNVTVNATVAPDGSVASTSSSGDDPVVAKCIESQVKTWRFPAPGSNQQIAIPFKFVRQ